MSKTPTPAMWARARSHLGSLPMLAIRPEDNLLIGAKAIMEYLGIRDIVSLERWTDEYALPVIKRPDGMWMTTLTSIDQWILLAAKVQYDDKLASGTTSAQKRAEKEARRKAKALEGHPAQAPVQHAEAPSSVEPVRQEPVP